MTLDAANDFTGAVSLSNTGSNNVIIDDANNLALGTVTVGGDFTVDNAGTMIARAGGFFAVVLASINIFGGFVVTQRMLAMYKKKK
ncbi:MAG TPA: hypothetical protein EYQ81_06695 [Sneathiellales bacterium]|nr:hypothetical protein [Sneathiellales bacterium]